MYITTNNCMGQAKCMGKCPTESIRLLNGKSFSCLTCGICHDICPNNAIFKNSYGGFVVDKSKCNGCGICVHACPIESIHIKNGKAVGICSMCGLCAELCDSRVDLSQVVGGNREKFLNSLRNTMPKISQLPVREVIHDENVAKRTCFDTDYDKCVLCGRCEYYCPTEAIIVKNEKDGICTNCNICEDVCPVDAIKNTEIDNDKCTLCLKCLKECPNNAITVDDFKIKINKTNEEIEGSIVSCLNCGLCADNYNDVLKKIDGKLRYDPQKDIKSMHDEIIEKCPVSTLKQTNNILEGYCVSCGKCYNVCQHDARKMKIIKWDGTIDEGCISCGICVESCPKDAITLKRGFISVDLDNCIMCETCGIYCPKDVIPKRTTVKMEISSGFNMIDSNLCVKCGMCEKICPEDAISDEEGIFKVDEEKCIYCGACMHICPSNAFIFEREFEEAK